MTDMGRMEWKELKVTLVFANSVTKSDRILTKME